MNNQIDYERIRARVEERMKKRRKFMSNLGGGITVVGVLWVIWLLTGTGWPWPLIPTAIVVIAATREYLGTFVFASAMENAYDREMAREIAREQARLGMGGGYVPDYAYEKSKRSEKVKRDDPWVRLSDDGELVPIDENDEAESEHRAASRNKQ